MSTWSGEIDMKDIAIIDAFPAYDCQKKVLSVGCGKGGIDCFLAKNDYRVYATDIKPEHTWKEFSKFASHFQLERLKSFEQLWLAFYMWESQQKVWANKEWRI